MKSERSKRVQDVCKELNIIMESNLDEEGSEDMKGMRGHKKVVYLKELKHHGGQGTEGSELESPRVREGDNRQ